MEDYNYTVDNYTVVTDDNVTLHEICRADKGQEVTKNAIQLTIFLVVFVLGVIGNVLVIATFTRYRRLRMRCMTDVFLFYLALSDLLLLLTLPFQTTEQWEYGDELCKLNHGMYAINTYGGLLLLACISIDRYLLVVRATAAHALRPSMLLYSKLSALAVAVTSVILSLPELLFASVVKGRCENIGNKRGFRINWARISRIVGFAVPFVAMLVCYSTIGNVLMQGRGKCWRRQRTLRLIVALVFQFLLFQLPYTLVLLIRLFMTDIEDCELWIPIHLAEDITRSLAYVRCCLNPLLYALVGVRFRNDVVRLLYNAGCKCLAHLAARPDTGSSITPSSPPPTYLPDAYTSTRISEDASSKSNQQQKFIF